MKRITTIIFALTCCTISHAQVTIGSDIPPVSGAVLDLKTQTDDNPMQGGITSDKGFLLPRVKLTANNSLIPISDDGAVSKASHKGLMVYHIGGNSIDPGQLVWDGDKWQRYLTQVPPPAITILNVRNLKVDASSGSIEFPDGDATNHPIAQELDFGEIKILEAGNYAFLIRIYGSIESEVFPTLPFPYKQPFYLFSLKNGEMIDAQELQENVLSTRHKYGTTAVLTVSDCKIDDIITLKVSKFAGRSKINAQGRPDNLQTAARTSLVYWKL